MYREENRFSFGHLAIAFFTGALTAVAATLLTTPITGRESRAHVRRLAQRGKDALARTPDAIRRGLRRTQRRAEDIEEELSGRIG